VSSIAAARIIARDSDAVVPGTAMTLVEDVASGRLALLDVALTPSHDKGAIMYLRDRTLSPAARAFLDQLREVSKQELPLAEKLMAEAIRAVHRRMRRRTAADAGAKGDAPARRRRAPAPPHLS
jgi:hypothetical protein